MRRLSGVLSGFLCVMLAGAGVAAASSPTDDQLHELRMRIDQLESQLGSLAAETESVAEERQRLDAELELADAKVREVELLLEQSGQEAALLREETLALAAELEERRVLLDRHLEIMALLGSPGPMQLFFDAYKGGDLEAAVGTVAVLTAGQFKLVEEYHEVRTRHSARLAELSQTLGQTKDEARQLELRRNELDGVRRKVALRLRDLERTRVSTGARLDDLREREAALERLVGVLSSRDRFTGQDDIRAYRGALPWPVDAPVVQGFGRQKLQNYSAYTVCNGLRFSVPGSTPVNAVFPGVVAYARHFKGYGNMVVLDHGQDVYSLVAGLGTIHVRVDQPVTMGMRLGLAPPPTDTGNIYLELRVDNKPEDPRRWLQLKGGPS